MEDLVTIQVRVPRSMREKFHFLTLCKGTSMSKVLVNAIIQYIRDEGKQYREQASMKASRDKGILDI